MSRIIYIKGDRVSLVVPEKTDIDAMYIGMNNPEIRKHLGVMMPLSYESEVEYYEKMTKPGGYKFMIMLNDGGKVIGNVSDNNHSDLDRKLEVGITIYFEEFLGKGYGTEAMQLYLKYVFDFLGYHKVTLMVKDFNERGYKSYLKSGFREIGRYKDDCYIGGRYYDRIAMEILEDEYREIMNVK